MFYVKHKSGQECGPENWATQTEEATLGWCSGAPPYDHRMYPRAERRAQEEDAKPLKLGSSPKTAQKGYGERSEATFPTREIRLHWRERERPQKNGPRLLASMADDLGCEDDLRPPERGLMRSDSRIIIKHMPPGAPSAGATEPQHSVIPSLEGKHRRALFPRAERREHRAGNSSTWNSRH
uniref:Uncharacterized protein n=1 Tax=Steinernema glaseri TaxID=37863 RepID=A0A1I7YYX8_9BILA